MIFLHRSLVKDIGTCTCTVHASLYLYINALETRQTTNATTDAFWATNRGGSRGANGAKIRLGGGGQNTVCPSPFQNELVTFLFF